MAKGRNRKNRLISPVETWRLLDLGRAEPLVAQAFYEAVAEAVHRGVSPNTLILVQPDSPYACIGYHQNLEKEIDIEYIEEAGLPVIRRSQGGGATYLDSGQVFYQIIAKGSHALPRNVDKLFEKLLAVTVESYRMLGVEASFKPLNDVVVEGRKLSGNGAGVHEDVTILVGNFIMEMNYILMARVLKVPDEKFRDKMAKSMEQWVSSFKKELGESPSPTSIKEVYVEVFQRLMDIKLEPSKPNEAENKIFAEETKPRHVSREWLYMESPKQKPGRAVKIAHEVKVIESDHKAGKLIRIRAEVKGTSIIDAQITGDFFVIPKEAINELETQLNGVELTEEALLDVVQGYYDEHNPESPGVTPRDIVDAFLKLKAHL
ncbi:MAG: lipoate--protein ligase family protein [Candidatus Bathyarchaeota archaeon]|nr:lipoate--protein ligase family protein [Candidatus Bathyarchaeota archaeon]